MFSQCSRAAFTAVLAAATACTVQLVAPYNSELEQKASSMEAEVSSWDLAMREGAGRIDDDPRNPDNVKMLNKWRGEADAMLTLIVSSDPGIVNCSEVAQKVYTALQDQLPEQVRANGQLTANASAQTSVPRSGCETAVVADINSGIDDAAEKLKYCKLDWVTDDYFQGMSRHAASITAPAAATSTDAQEKLNRSCLAEFKETPPGESSPGTRHGRAVSHLLTTLQVIVYVENRKKAAASK
jgi:hypothetical protein